MTITEPIFFGENRVWRCYTGGLLMDRFVGVAEPSDSHLPEDWLASTVRAINGEHSQGPDEGLARMLRQGGAEGELLAELLEQDAASILGQAHAAKYGPNLGVLCKYLDSAVRLPIQCHPDVATARKLYDSEFGKTESWHILDTRVIDGEEPYLLMGFKPGVTKEAFTRAVEQQDVATMSSMLHKLRPRAGETYFVPARLPHAIGPGVFMVETQEPSDWVIQPERFCADTCLSDADMWGPLTPEQGLDVFEYAGCEQDELLTRVKMTETVVADEAGGTVSEIIGPRQTEAFCLWRAQVKGELAVPLPRGFGIVVVAAGAGSISWGGASREIRKGEYFLQPCGVESIRYVADEPLSLLLCMPPAP